MHRAFTFTVALCALSFATSRVAIAQSAADSAAIRATALDYVEGWYEGNAERMGRASMSGALVLSDYTKKAIEAFDARA